MKSVVQRWIFAVLIPAALLTGCKDYSELNLEPVESGEADFTSYVAIGNSLTAGFQNGALYQSAQAFSYPAIIARQLRLDTAFTQPLISDPGIGSRIELISLDPIVTTLNPNQGEPINQNEKPFNNLGIPGAILVDYLNPDGAGNLDERATDPTNPSYNPFYAIVLEESELEVENPSIHSQVVELSPTLITFWLGNSDALAFVVAGGEVQPTDPAVFADLYQASADSLASTGASVVLYNIPDVTGIPFVFLLRAQLRQSGLIEFNTETGFYELVTSEGNFPIWIEVDGEPQQMQPNDYPILTASSYFAQVQGGEVPPPIQPENAIPDSLVLDGPREASPGVSELEQIYGVITQYNLAIESAASAHGFALVDVNGIFAEILENYVTSEGTDGYQVDGLTLLPLPGSLFSLDGITVSNRGSAVIANETIRTMNSVFDSDVPLVDIRVIPEGIPVSTVQ